MLLRLDDVVERAIFLYGLHEYRSAQAFCRLLNPGSTVVDVGAHVGQYTLLAAKRASRVVAFEPRSETRARLERNVSASGFENVEVLPFAVGREDGEVQLAEPEAGNSGTAAVVAAGGRPVPIRTLDSVLGDARVDVLKIDVEGLEGDVLSGAEALVRRSRPAILVEINDLAVVAQLRDLGYAINAVGDGGELVPLAPGDDPRDYAEPWSAPNVVALPD